MSRLLWSQPGTRRFEAGIDQTALYLADGSVIPWTGVVSIDENFEDATTKPVYYDGIKIRDIQPPGDFSANLKALAYPHELLDLVGVKEIDTGLFVDGQQPKVFNMAYRTLVGNDTLGIELGYKLHLLYNVTAVTDSVTYSTLNTSISPSEIGLSLYAVPDKAPNYRPTAHVILDSTRLNPDIFDSFETILYGDETNDPRFPSIEELIQLAMFFDPKRIIPHTDTGIAELIDGYGDFTQTKTQGIYFGLPENRLIPSTWEGYYWLEKPPDPSTTFWFDFEGGIPNTFVKTTDMFGTPFNTVSPNLVPYGSPGKNSNTGIVVAPGALTAYLQWDNPTTVDKLSVGFWFKPAIIPASDVRIMDIRETPTSNTLGGLLYKVTTGRIWFMIGTVGFSTGQSPALTLDAWHWITFSWNATSKIAKMKVYDSDGVLLHDSGSFAFTSSYAGMKTVRFIRPAGADIGASAWDMLQYEPGSDVLLDPWMI